MFISPVPKHSELLRQCNYRYLFWPKSNASSSVYTVDSRSFAGFWNIAISYIIILKCLINLFIFKGQTGGMGPPGPPGEDGERVLLKDFVLLQ